MIGRIQGQLLAGTEGGVLIDCGGVGYEIRVSLNTWTRLPSAGSEVTLLIHTVIRPDEQLLYGFAAEEERKLFRALIRVSGIGPALALKLLSALEPEVFVRTLSMGDVKGLTAVPGIGRKMADRLVLELQGQFSEGGFAARAEPGTGRLQERAREALMALGFGRQEAADAVARVLERKQPENEGALVKEALKLSGNR